MWENWEDGFQKVYDFQKRMEENSLNAFKKQQDVIQSMKTNFDEAEEQLEKSFNQMKKSLDKNNKKNIYCGCCTCGGRLERKNNRNYG